ncbi:MAG: aminotransferase class V-fold PLP-dependent enzyme [Ilumatobacteraceae bacterium]
MPLAPRDLWDLDPATTYLNHGSFGAVPRAVTAAQLAIRERCEANPNRFFRSELPDLLAYAGAACAARVGVAADRFAFVPNASQGVIAATAALLPARDATIATASANYGGVVLGLRELARRRGATLRGFPTPSPERATPAGWIDAVLDGARAADVLVVDQIVATTAQHNPVGRLIPELRRAAPGCRIVVDAAHVVGHLEPAVPRGVDAWVSNHHKWACAPRASAALVCDTDEAAAAMAPMAGSWDAERAFPHNFDAQGTDDVSSYLATPAGWEFLDRWPREARDAHCRGVADAWVRALCDAWGVESPTHPDLLAPWLRVVPLPIARALAPHEVDALIVAARERLGAEVAVTTADDRTYLRLSAFLYNGADDVHRARIADLADLAADMAGTRPAR